MTPITLVQIFINTFKAKEEFDKLPPNIQQLLNTLNLRIQQDESSKEIIPIIDNIFELAKSTKSYKDDKEKYFDRITDCDNQEKVIAIAKKIFIELTETNAKDQKLKALAKLYFYLAHVRELIQSNSIPKKIPLYKALVIASNAYILTNSFNLTLQRFTFKAKKSERESFFKSIPDFKSGTEKQLFDHTEAFVNRHRKKDGNHYLITLYDNLLQKYKPTIEDRKSITIKTDLNIRTFLSILFAPLIQNQNSFNFATEVLSLRTQNNSSQPSNHYDINQDLSELQDSLYSQPPKPPLSSFLNAAQFINNYGRLIEKKCKKYDDIQYQSVARMYYHLSLIMQNTKTIPLQFNREIRYRDSIKAVIDAYNDALEDDKQNRSNTFLEILGDLIELLEDPKSHDHLIYLKLEEFTNQPMLASDEFFIKILCHINTQVAPVPTMTPVIAATTGTAKIATKPQPSITPPIPPTPKWQPGFTARNIDNAETSLFPIQSGKNEKLPTETNYASVGRSRQQTLRLLEQKRQQRKTTLLTDFIKIPCEVSFNQQQLALVIMSKSKNNLGDEPTPNPETFYNLLQFEPTLVGKFLLSLSSSEREKLLPEIKENFSIKRRTTVATEFFGNRDKLHHESLPMQYQKIHEEYSTLCQAHNQAKINFTAKQNSTIPGELLQAEHQIKSTSKAVDEFCLRDDVYKMFVLKYCEQKLGPIATIMYAKHINMDLSIWQEDSEGKITISHDTVNNRTILAKINLYYQNNNFAVMEKPIGLANQNSARPSVTLVPQP